MSLLSRSLQLLRSSPALLRPRPHLATPSASFSKSSLDSNFVKQWGILSAKIFIGLELLSLAGSYAFYRKVNSDPEMRFTLATSPRWHPILEYYYKLGEYMDKDCPIRENDLKLWRSEGRIL